MKSVWVLLSLIGIGFINSAEAINGDATWYSPSVGLVACGTHHGDDEWIAATAFSYWTTGNPNVDPMCNKRARVTDPASGKSVTVRIRDKCAGCKRGDIDLSSGAFKQLRDLGVGRFKVNWDFV